MAMLDDEDTHPGAALSLCLLKVLLKLGFCSMEISVSGKMLISMQMESELH